MDKNNYRHEYKYLIDQAQLGYLKNIASMMMDRDANAINGLYNIRSLYFDDYNNTCFYDNENGIDPREKIRIRIYNHSKERISLEYKRKENDKTYKTSCLINYDQCQCLMKGETIKNEGNVHPLIKKINSKILTEGYRPVIIDEYDRIPFVMKEGNVRVTFDTHISSSNYINMFFDDNIPKRPIMPCGFELLEVKYDDFLSDTVYSMLQIGALERTMFSKYYYSRCYELGKIINGR